jgi:hypothetical protein
MKPVHYYYEQFRPWLKRKLSVSQLNIHSRVDKFLDKYLDTIKKGVCSILSPTWYLARITNEGLSREDKTKVVKTRNYFYLFVSIALIFLLVILEVCTGKGMVGIPSNQPNDNFLGVILSWLFAFFVYVLIWSRCNEIFIAFISDALDKTEGKEPSTDLTYRDRITLSFFSYVELILNFAIIYSFMPEPWFDSGLKSIIDAVYFSGVTITTLGFGDISPQHWLPQILVLHQVLAGFTLIVVSFAIYAGRGLSSEKETENEEETK